MLEATSFPPRHEPVGNSTTNLRETAPQPGGGAVEPAGHGGNGDAVSEAEREEQLPFGCRFV
ncbi:MAG: hypothetical protein ABSE25_03520 [Syntrophorhabdales bacterium]